MGWLEACLWHGPFALDRNPEAHQDRFHVFLRQPRGVVLHFHFIQRGSQLHPAHAIPAMHVRYCARIVIRERTLQVVDQLYLRHWSSGYHPPSAFNFQRICRSIPSHTSASWDGRFSRRTNRRVLASVDAVCTYPDSRSKSSSTFVIRSRSSAVA